MTWAPVYVEVDEQQDYMRISDDDDDIELASAIEAASRAVDDACNRQFGSVAAQERAYTPWFDYEQGRWVVDIDDLQDADELAVTINGTAVTSYTLAPANAVMEGLAWTRLVIGRDAEAQPTGAQYEVLATAPWGWLAFPGAIVLATKLQASRFHSRRNSPYGIAGSPDNNSEMRLLAKVDPDVSVALRRYRRPRRMG